MRAAWSGGQQERTGVIRSDRAADDEQKSVGSGSYTKRVLGSDERRSDVERVTGLGGDPMRVEHDEPLDQRREGLSVEGGESDSLSTL